MEQPKQSEPLSSGLSHCPGVIDKYIRHNIGLYFFFKEIALNRIFTKSYFLKHNRNFRPTAFTLKAYILSVVVACWEYTYIFIFATNIKSIKQSLANCELT